MFSVSSQEYETKLQSIPKKKKKKKKTGGNEISSFYCRLWRSQHKNLSLLPEEKIVTAPKQ